MRNICFLLLMTLVSCGSDRKPVKENEGTFYPYNSTLRNSSECNTIESKSGGRESSNIDVVMSDEESAYEMGRALAEEDRLNGSRQHEGEIPDEDDCEDDYDEGYEE